MSQGKRASGGTEKTPSSVEPCEPAVLAAPDLSVGESFAMKRLYLNAFIPIQMFVLACNAFILHLPHAGVPSLCLVGEEKDQSGIDSLFSNCRPFDLQSTLFSPVAPYPWLNIAF